MNFMNILKITYATINVAFSVIKLVPAFTKHKDMQKVLDAHDQITSAIDTVVQNTSIPTITQ